MYLSALLVHHDPIDGWSLFPHDLSKRFFKGMVHLYPPIKHLMEAWDLPLVLRCLTRKPFEPVATCDLKLLSLKMLFLVTITLVYRFSKLATLDIGPLFYLFLLNAVCLATIVMFLHKVVWDFHLQSVNFQISI